MTVTLNAFEVFEIAEQIERNGAKYYRKAAELFNDPDIHKMFLGLTEWETKHEQCMRDMGEQLSKEDIKPRNIRTDDDLPDPKVMACLAVFGTASEPIYKLKNLENPAELLKMAVEKEKDSIVYYFGLKDFVPDGTGQNKIDDIINEEMCHIRILSEALEQRQ